MIIYSRVTEQPDSEPVTLAEAKTHLEYTGTAKNDYIETLISVARRICEAYSGLSFVTQERVIRLDKFPKGKRFIYIPYGPVQAILTFTYRNDDGGTTTLEEGTDFAVDTHSSVARAYAINSDGEIDDWPTDVLEVPHAITLSYQAGYDDVSGELTPAQVKQAILLQVASMFETRQDEQPGIISHKICWNSEAILDTIKVTWNANAD